MLVAPIPCMTTPYLAHYTLKVTKAKPLKTADRENGDKIILEEQENNKATLPSTELIIHPYRVSCNCSRRFSLLEASSYGCLYPYQSGACYFRFRDCTGDLKLALGLSASQCYQASCCGSHQLPNVPKPPPASLQCYYSLQICSGSQREEIKIPHALLLMLTTYEEGKKEMEGTQWTTEKRQTKQTATS